MTNATNLYEALGLTKDATAEDVRKAYRKHALKTHPDRLPQDATPEQRAATTERFREISTAYEVLNDPNNRELYDRHGVWPPPTAPTQPSNGFANRSGPFNNDLFSHPFFNAQFGSPHHPNFGFTDPFILFNAFFGDAHRAFEDDSFFGPAFPQRPPQPFASSSRDPSGMHDPFGGSPFGFGSSFPFGRSLLADFGGPGNTFGGGSSSRVYSSVQRATGSEGQWVSQSSVTRTINGRTENIVTKRDAQGNEHVTYTSPEGVRHTINGVDQPSQGQRAINAPPSSSRPTGPPPAVAAPPPVNYQSRPPPQDYERAAPPYEHHSSTRYSRHHSYDSPPVIPVSRHSSNSGHSHHYNHDGHTEHDRHDYRHQRSGRDEHGKSESGWKRWYQGGW